MKDLFQKFMAAAVAGLVAWIIQALAADTWDNDMGVTVPLAMGLIGALVSGIVAASEGHFEFGRIEVGDVFVAASAGVVACGLLGLGTAWLATKSGAAAGSSGFGQIVSYGSWIAAGAAVGACSAIRMRSQSTERLRTGLYGGIIGGAAGAAVQFAGGQLGLVDLSGQVANASGYALVGAAVAFGIGIAPGLTAFAVLEFRQSSHAESRNKWTYNQRVVLGKETFAVGKRPSVPDKEQRKSVRGIRVPGDQVRDIHCWISFQNGGFYLSYPEDNKPGSPGHQAILGNGIPLKDNTRLVGGMLLTIGESQFEFLLKREDQR